MSEEKAATGNADEIAETLRRNERLVAVGEFAAMAMHDIRDPLEAISNLAYLIEADAESPEEVRRNVRLLEEQRVIATDIIRRTLGNYQASEDGGSADLCTVVEAALRMHRHRIAKQSLELRKELPGEAKVGAHAGEMLQVLSNLIANALDAVPAGGVLRIRVRRSARYAHVLIADNGPGIPASLLAKVFHPFFTTKGERGTGLGLAISKTLLERNDGSIRVRSSMRSGRSGTAFRLSLPLHAEAV